MISGYPIAEGGMRFTFPPYGKKIDGKFKNNYVTKIPCCCSLLYIWNKFINIKLHIPKYYTLRATSHRFNKGFL